MHFRISYISSYVKMYKISSWVSMGLSIWPYIQGVHMVIVTNLLILISDQEIVRNLKHHNILYLVFFKILKLVFYSPYFQCESHCLFCKSNYPCPLGSYVVKDIDVKKLWIGVTDSTEEGTWTWVNRTTVISGWENTTHDWLLPNKLFTPSVSYQKAALGFECCCFFVFIIVFLQQWSQLCCESFSMVSLI